MNIDELRDNVIKCRRDMPKSRVCLIGISGIDASGKGYVTDHLGSQPELAGYRVAVINVDAWLNLPHLRFSERDPALHFYNHALRLDEMFDGLVVPLKDCGTIDLAMDYAGESATSFRPHMYCFRDVEIILLEGIFIFKRRFVDHFDLKIWIECSFEAALARAEERRQEDLPSDQTMEAYETIYFPAQRYHFEVDDPTAAADIIYTNE
jgi:uridine kinase